MELEKIPSVPTADEVLDRCFRRAAAKKKLKLNKDRANEEFVRSVASAVHDNWRVWSRNSEFRSAPPFYREVVDILFTLDRLKRSLGAVMWAAGQARMVGYQQARSMRYSGDTGQVRKQAVARISSIVHQVEKDLEFLNDARNVLRKLPDVREDEYTVVVGGYPNVGKSSFIRLSHRPSPRLPPIPSRRRASSSAIAPSAGNGCSSSIRPAFWSGLPRSATHREAGTLRPCHTADAVLFIIDPSEHCGYSIEDSACAA